MLLTVLEQRASRTMFVKINRQKRVAELRRCPPSTDQEQALTDLDTGARQEREWVAWRISAAEFRQRRDSKGLTELTRVEGERGVGAQHMGLWRDNSGGACTTAGVQSRCLSCRQGGGRGWACPAGGGNSNSRNNRF